MTVTIEGKKYKYTFRHIVPEMLPFGSKLEALMSTKLDTYEAKRKLKAFRLTGATECYIVEVEDIYSVEPQGVSLCCGLDKFDKEKGRQVALGRALQRVFTKNNPNWKTCRREFWRAYFHRDASQKNPRHLG